MEHKKYFSIGAIFKNESMILKEWIDHYFYHGVDHIYLINDHSSDEYLSILKPYIQKGIVTLYHTDIEKRRGRQTESYNLYFRDALKETKWLAIFDIDEFLYSPQNVNLKEVLKQYEHLHQITVNWVWFGTNGKISQPKSIVQSLTKRAPFDFKALHKTPNGMEICDTLGNKCIINTQFALGDSPLGIHGHHTINPSVNLSWVSDAQNPIFLINHYSLISKEYWQEVKMKRGDADCWHADNARDLEWLKVWDNNELDDFSLYHQNSNLFKEV